MTTTFVVWDDTSAKEYNACKLVQKEVHLFNGTHVNIEDMSVDVSPVEDDRLEVTIPEYLNGIVTWLNWTKESEYEHTKKFWYSNVLVHDLANKDLSSFFFPCNADQQKVSYRRRVRIVKGSAGNYITKKEW